MPEDVPADSRKPDFFSGRFQDLSLNNACAGAAARNMRREDKPTRTVPFPATQDLSKCRIKWDVIVGRLGFHFSDPAVDDTLLNQHRSGLEVDMLPAEGQHLGHPHPGTHRNNDHRPVRLTVHGNQVLKLLRAENLRFFQPLAGL